MSFRWVVFLGLAVVFSGCSNNDLLGNFQGVPSKTDMKPGTMMPGDGGTPKDGDSPTASYTEQEAVDEATNNTVEEGEVVGDLPQTIAGTIGDPIADPDTGDLYGDIDFYCFAGDAGDVLALQAAPDGSSPVNPLMIIRQESDRSYLRVSRPDASRQTARQAYLPASGKYCVGITYGDDQPTGGAAHTYNITLSKTPFAATQTVTLPYAQTGMTAPQDLPVGIFEFTPTTNMAIEARSISAELPGGEVDSILYVVNQDLSVAQVNDDITPVNTDALIRYLVGDTANQYLVVDHVDVGGDRRMDVVLDAYDPAVEREPNNRRQILANPIRPPGVETTEVVGALDRPGPGDVDYFAIDATAGDYLEVIVTRDDTANPAFVPSVAFFDLDVTSFFENPNATHRNYARIEGWALESKRYIVLVRPHVDFGAPPVGAADFKYRLSIKKIARPELNLGTLPLPQPALPSQIDKPGTTKWYAFVVPAGGAVYNIEPDLRKIGIDTNDGLFLSSNMTLIGNDGKTVQMGGPYWLFEDLYLPPGQYRLGIGDTRGGYGSGYQVRPAVTKRTATIDEETPSPHGNQASAQSLPATLGTPAVITAEISQPGEADWYALGTLNQGAHVYAQTTLGALGLNAPPMGARLYLVDSTGSDVNGDESGSPAATVVFDVPTTGTYYVRVEGADPASTTGKYAILARILSCSISFDSAQLNFGDLSINEIFPGTTQKTFVEVVNYTPAPVDVSYFRLRGRAPGEYYTMCPAASGAPTPVEKVYVACLNGSTVQNCTETKNATSLFSTTGWDAVVLFDSFGLAMDRTVYSTPGTASFNRVPLLGDTTCDVAAPNSNITVPNNTCTNAMGTPSALLSSPGKKADGSAF